MKNFKIISLILCLYFGITSTSALDGHVDYNSVNIDYSVLTESEYQKLGNSYLAKAEKKGNTKIQTDFYYSEALGAYLTAIETNPLSINTYGKIGYIYGKLGKYSLGRSYFDRGLNLDRTNPNVNFYFAGFFYDDKDYNRAIKYYKFAEKYGYSNKFALYFRLGETYEKLADLQKAKYYYQKASALKSDMSLKQKIRSIDDLKYNKSQYYIHTKPFDYN